MQPTAIQPQQQSNILVGRPTLTGLKKRSVGLAAPSSNKSVQIGVISFYLEICRKQNGINEVYLIQDTLISGIGENFIYPNGPIGVRFLYTSIGNEAVREITSFDAKPKNGGRINKLYVALHTLRIQN
ncbi:hypothetical protein Vadar_026269 [Vaccinium darrowii]|uniref:Uncharacterized protein n=1 Tax=Vaccinium darrowii TaxID=229202 RepID=A0ACB7ZLY0_9ERIC|nr:hypothetical protein Vadar_026269 [Vaccinium darrowii]